MAHCATHYSLYDDKLDSHTETFTKPAENFSRFLKEQVKLEESCYQSSWRLWEHCHTCRDV